MAITLEMIDVSGDVDEPTGQTATLEDDGTITYKGDGVKDLMAVPLRTMKPGKVFDRMNGWSNGYVALRKG